jgi:hypothetical protein
MNRPRIRNEALRYLRHVRSNERKGPNVTARPSHVCGHRHLCLYRSGILPHLFQKPSLDLAAILYQIRGIAVQRTTVTVGKMHAWHEGVVQVLLCYAL